MVATIIERSSSRKTMSMLNQLMNQSTIYNRNEARRAKTLALKDDPRSAPIRVLSGLPGFRSIIPPFQPGSKVVTAATVYGALMIDGDESNRFIVEASFTDREKAGYHCQSRVGPTMFSAAFAGALSELLMGSSRDSFVNGYKGPYQPFMSTHHLSTADAAWVALLQRQAPVGAQQPWFQEMSYNQIGARAISTSVLFGSKAMGENLFRDANDDTKTLVSSSFAGLSAGLMSVARGAGTKYIRPEILTTSAYFAMYEFCRGSMPKDNNWSIAVAGSMAGLLYEVSRSLTIPCANLFHPATMPSARQLGYTAMRAIPNHAILFLGFETMKDVFQR